MSGTKFEKALMSVRFFFVVDFGSFNKNKRIMWLFSFCFRLFVWKFWFREKLYERFVFSIYLYTLLMWVSHQMFVRYPVEKINESKKSSMIYKYFAIMIVLRIVRDMWGLIIQVLKLPQNFISWIVITWKY